MSLFIANYSRELRIGVNIRREEEMENTMEFAEKKRKYKRKQNQY